MRLVASLALVVALCRPAAAEDTPAPSPAPSPAPTPAPPPPVVPPPAPSRITIELTSLRLMRAKGILSDAEYESAVRDIAITAGGKAAEAPTLVIARWSTTLYGFANLTIIGDSTRSFGDVAANFPIQRAGAKGENGRVTFSARFTRIGWKLRAPEWHRMIASGVVEIDFLGGTPPGATESQVFSAPGVRLFNAAFKLETPWIDVLAGQWWSLFGWQPAFFPCYGQLTGLPAQGFARNPQLRLSHRFKLGIAELELAGAIARPPQRDGSAPDGQVGARLQFNTWRGKHTTAATGTQVVPVQLGVSAALRRLVVPSFLSSEDQATLGWGVSFDAVLPLVPATPSRRANFLTATGSLVYGYAIGDLYASPPGGVLPFASRISADPGLVGYDEKNQPKTVQWTSFIVGLQYYLPPDARVWIAANYSQMMSANLRDFGQTVVSFSPVGGTLVVRSRLADANLFWDVVPSVRVGLEYAWFEQMFDDGVVVQNHRGQFTAYYLF